MERNSTGVRVDVSEHSVPKTGGGTGVLEARLFAPRFTALGADAAVDKVAVEAKGNCALVLHQYSVMGGSQDLMRGLARRVAMHGVPALTFNFSGVGRSGGRASFTGHREVDDVVSAGRFLEVAGFTHVLLLCSSAGCAIGGSALDRLPLFTGYVALGYTFGNAASILFGSHFDAVLASCKPKLFVQGDRDEFTSAAQLTGWAVPRSNSAVTEARILPGVSHFELEGAAWDEQAASWAVEFATRVGAFRL